MDKARRIAILSMVVSGLLAAIKISAGLMAHSTSVLADGFESAADVFASGLVLAALIIAARPADENHPYGHGRIETLTGLVIGFFLLDAGILIAWHGISGTGDISGTPHAWAIWPLVISTFAKGGLVVLKREQARRTGSQAMGADAANDAVDILSGISALIALSLTLWKPVEFRNADHYGAFVVGLIVIGTGFRIMRDTSLNLMDTMPGDSEMQEIRRVALGVPHALGVEKCFARKTGLKYHVDLHLEVDPQISVQSSHDIAERVRNQVRHELNWVQDVLVHVEPYPGPMADGHKLNHTGAASSPDPKIQRR